MGDGSGIFRDHATPRLGFARKRDVILDRLEQAEKLLASRLRPGVIERRLAAEWGLTPRAVRAYLRAVRKRWERESRETPRDERRAHLRASLDALFVRSLDRTRAIATDTGDVHEVADPDLRTASRTLDQLARLDGLYEAEKRETHVSVEVAHLSDDQLRAELRAAAIEIEAIPVLPPPSDARAIPESHGVNEDVKGAMNVPTKEAAE